MARDPVCGMMVDPQIAEFKVNFQDKTYYFCNNVCKTEFEKNSLKYIKKKGFFARFLEWIANANKEQYGDKPPSCCGHN